MVRPLPTFAFLALALSACGTPDFNIPAPWEPVEGPRAEVPTANLQPTAPPWARIGSSIRGKPIVAATLGDGPLRVYVIGGIAGDEPEGPAAAEVLRDELFKAVFAHATIRVVRDMNPDGSANRTRANTRSVDLTRNWPSRDHIAGRREGAAPASELETTVIQKDLAAFTPDLVVVFRSSAGGPVVAMAGPGRVV
ncbi:MAG: M14 family zinc carboxypeptidase, partial [Phycisphaerales bacterium]